MALHGKIETEVELKSSVDEYYNAWRRQSFHFPKHTPKHVQGVDVHEGDWETHGSVRVWKYTIGGREGVFKEKVHFDDANKTITLNGLEGDVMKIYKVYKSVWKLTPKGSGTLANVSIEYEKTHPDIPVPEKYLDYILLVTEDVDEAIAQA